MDALWAILITGGLMAVYAAVLVRASSRGKQWARDALKAIACMAEGPMAASVWLAEERDQEEADLEPEPESESELVA